MKIIRNTFICCLSVLMLVSSTSVFAADSLDTRMSVQAQENFNKIPAELQEDILADEDLLEAAKYAYLDMDSASEAMREHILAARSEIIFSRCWTVNGLGYIEHADGTIEDVPSFAELFPGWDVPTWETSAGSPMTSAFSVNGSVVDDTLMDVYDILSYTIPKYSDSVETRIMTRAQATSFEFLGVRVLSLAPASCNIGISHNGISDGWAPRLSAGSFFRIFPQVGLYYDIRVSTYDTSGLGNFRVFH